MEITTKVINPIDGEEVEITLQLSTTVSLVGNGTRCLNVYATGMMLLDDLENNNGL